MAEVSLILEAEEGSVLPEPYAMLSEVAVTRPLGVAGVPLPRCDARHDDGPAARLLPHYHYVCTRHRYWIGPPDVGQQGVEPRDAGTAGALNNVSQQLGPALGVALISTFVATATNHYLTHHGSTAVVGATVRRRMSVPFLRRPSRLNRPA